MKNPYFKWYPADAEMDDAYSTMTNAQVGMYHRLLNRAWLNDGIPADPEEIRKMLHMDARWFRRDWDKVRHKFVANPLCHDRLVNPRMEMERQQILAKSLANQRIGNANAFKSRSEKNANASQHALARAESVSVSDSASELSLISGRKENLGRARKETLEVGRHFEEFWAQYPRQQHREQALHAWCFVATVENEEEIFSCLASYKASNDVLVRGATMYAEKWLNDQNVDHWASRWDPPKKSQRKMTASELALQEILQGSKNGTD